jgi:hypothetical protein
MAGIDATEIIVGLTGRIYTAPVGTAYPTDAATTPAGTWVDLGYASIDGVTVKSAGDIKDVEVWQSLYPARKVKVKQSFDIKFALVQWNTKNLELAFGGGAVATQGTGTKFTPPAPSFIDERSFLVEVDDGSNVMRIAIDRGIAMLDSDVVFKKDQAATMGMTVSAIAYAGSGVPWGFHFINTKMVVG